MLCILFYYIIQVSKGHKAYVLAYWRDDLLIRHNIREYKAYNSPLKRIKSYCSPYLQRKDGGKHMIRFILIVLFLGIFFISSILIFPVVLLIGLFSKKARDRVSFSIVSWAFGIIIRIAGTKVDIIGYDNIPKDQAVLYVGNHRSMFDIAINYWKLPPLLGFVSKIEMKKFPFLSWWMILVKCLFLDRDNIKEGMKTIIKGTEQLKAGISMFIFPEGTRNKNEYEMLEFKEGSLKMAEKAGTLIVPVAITNTGACFEDHFPKVKKTHVVIEYGKPIDLSAMDKETKKRVGAYTREIIQEMVNKNRGLI